MKEKKILDKYRGKVLATESYGNCRELYVEDFAEEEKMLHELYKMNCFEIDLTDEGLEFLEQYYALDKIADLILEDIKNGVDYSYSKKEGIIEWIKRKGAFTFGSFRSVED